MSKKARKEGVRVANLIKAAGTEYYISDIDLGGNLSLISVAGQALLNTLGKRKVAFMLISAGENGLAVCSHVPPKFENLDASSWNSEATKYVQVETKEKDENFSIYWATVDNPFKSVDGIRAQGFSYLKSLDMIEEESSEEFIGFDDF